MGLGILYEEGKGVEQDYRKAADHYERAANLGIIEAQVRLGRLYEEGKGVDPDFIKAKSLYSQAIHKGYKSVHFDLGRLYEKGGKGVDQDFKKAAEQYEKAGTPEAKQSLERLKQKQLENKGKEDLLESADKEIFSEKHSAPRELSATEKILSEQPFSFSGPTPLTSLFTDKNLRMKLRDDKEFPTRFSNYLDSICSNNLFKDKELNGFKILKEKIVKKTIEIINYDGDLEEYLHNEQTEASSRAWFVTASLNENFSGAIPAGKAFEAFLKRLLDEKIIGGHGKKRHTYDVILIPKKLITPSLMKGFGPTGFGDGIAWDSSKK